MISVVCPIFNEEKYIDKCINSILEQDFPREEMEVLFVDGMSSDRTREIVNEYIKKYSFISLLDNPNKEVSYAMNIGIRKAKGDIIIRIDAHSLYPSNYFSLLIINSKRLKADNVGGLCRTLPVKDSLKAKCIAAGLSSGFGVGNSYFRIGTNTIREVDTVPFGCFKKELFERIGYFDTELIRNQDDEFNARIIKNGGKIFLIPELVIDYYARDTISKVLKMFYQYGLFKPLVNKKIGHPATIRQFFPALFLLGIVFGGILSFFSSIFLYFYIFILLLYMSLSLFFAFKAAIVYKNYNILLLLPYIFLLIHLSYGFGYINGIYKVIRNKSFSVNTNR